MLCQHIVSVCLTFIFFNDPATTEIYPLSLHDALPIAGVSKVRSMAAPGCASPADRPGSGPSGSWTWVVGAGRGQTQPVMRLDRKSTRLNSSHANISYAVFCLKKKKLHTRHYVPARIDI